MMKLISLHINNYGKLSNFDLKFDNISSICEDNGYGKSTLASFIKAMLYGLESVKSSSVKFLDRKHFYPFKGGKFGGNIIFTYNNHEYRIERDFDEKSDTKDSLVIYKDNNETDELGDIPGETLFGINKESFERLILINSDKISIETDSDINQKLNNYVENVGEDFDIEVVKKKINEKKKDNNTLIKEYKLSIGKLNDDIKNLEIIKENLDSKYIELNKLAEENNKANDLYDEAAKSGMIHQKWKSYDLLVEAKNNTNNELNKLKDKYPNGIPSKNEVDSVKKDITEITKLEGSINSSVVTDENRNEYDRLSLKYKKHLPTTNELMDVDDKIDSYYECVESSGIKTEKSEREIELETHFYGTKVTEDDVKKFEEEVSNLTKLEEELRNTKPSILRTERKQNDKKKMNKGLFIALIILSIVLLGIDVGLLFVNVIAAIVVFAIDLLVCLVTSLIIYINKSIKGLNEEVAVEVRNPDYDVINNKVIEQKNKVNTIFASYRYTGNNPEVLLYQFKNELNEYNNILKEKDKLKAKIGKSQLLADSLKQELDDFFTSVNMNGIEYKDAIEIVKGEVKSLETLKKVIESSDGNKKELNNKLTEHKNNVNNFYNKYSIDKNYKIDDISSDVDNYLRLEKDLKDKEDSANKYKLDNKLVNRPTDSNVDLEALREAANKAALEFTNLKQEIEGLENETSTLDDKKNQLDEYKNLRLEAESKVKLYTNLIAEIDKADQVLKDRYVAPIRDKFTYYANLIEKTIGEKVSMDKNYKISFDRDGALRSFEHLSSGNLAICALCFRLALLDNMFDGELPFIIMDDPFVMLDSKHFKKTKDLVKELSKDKQIIYFCCHDSRVI